MKRLILQVNVFRWNIGGRGETKKKCNYYVKVLPINQPVDSKWATT
jgi:hypothetical protein